MTDAQYDKLVTWLGTQDLQRNDTELANAANAPTVERIRSSMSGDELFAATVPAGFAALTEHKQVLWTSFCGRDSINPDATANVEFVKWIFGPTSATVAALVEARKTLISWATSEGLPTVHPGHIASARQMMG